MRVRLPALRSARRARVRLLLAVGLLVFAELTLTFWARYVRTPYETWDLARATPALVPGTHATGSGSVQIDVQGFVARRPEPASLGDAERPLFRIAALGDSCTFGAGDDASTYPAALERQLQRHGSTLVRYAVTNAGIAGLDSDEAIGRLAYTLEVLRPDVVILYLGWNDLTKRTPRAQSDPSLPGTLARFVDGLWLSRGLRKLVYYRLRPWVESPRAERIPSTGRFADFEPRIFEQNLVALIERTRAAGARPLLVTLPHSLRADLRPMDLSDPRLQFPYFSGGSQLGDFLDLIERYNDTIRRVGAERGVPVADVARRFAVITHPEAYFLDTMHPTPRGNELIAEVLERSLEQAALLAPAPTAGLAPSRI